MNIKINYQTALQNQIKAHQQAIDNRNELKKRFQYAKNNINKLKQQCVNTLKLLSSPQQLIQSFNFIKDYKSAQKCYQYLKNFDKILSKDKDRNKYINISYPKIREINKILLDLLDVYSGIGDDYKPINLEQIKLNLVQCGQKAKQILSPIVNNLQGQLDIIVQSTDSVDIYVDNNKYLMFSIWDINNQQIIQNIMQDAQQEFKDDEQVSIQSVNKYINIISLLKNKNKKQKILLLYTARPVSHRKQLSQIQGLPNGIYLTSSLSFAQGFGADYGQSRDIWQVKISNKYVLETLSDGYNKQYRIAYNGIAPCQKQLLQLGQRKAKNWYSQIKIANKIIAYHVTDANFNKFNLFYTAQGILWFTTDINSIKNRTTGSHASKIILTCELNINKTAGWDQYQKMGIWQLKRQGFDSVKLDQDYIIFDPKNVKIIKRENNIKTAQNIHNLLQLDPEKQGGAYFNIGHHKAFPHSYKPEDINNIEEYVYLWTQKNGLALNKVQTGMQIHQNLFKDFFDQLDRQQAQDIQNKMCFVFGRIDNKDGWRASTKRANACRSNWSDSALSKFRKDLSSRFPNIKIYT